MRKFLSLMLVVLIVSNSILVYAQDYTLIDNNLGMKIAPILIGAGLAFSSYEALVSATNNFIGFISIHFPNVYNRVVDLVQNGLNQITLDDEIFSAVEAFVQAMGIGQVDIVGTAHIPLTNVFGAESIVQQIDNDYVVSGVSEYYDWVLNIPEGTIAIVAASMQFSGTGSGSMELTLRMSASGNQAIAEKYIYDAATLVAGQLYNVISYWYLKKIGGIYYASVDGVTWKNVGTSVKNRIYVLPKLKNLYFSLALAVATVAEVSISIPANDVSLEIDDARKYREDKEVFYIPPIADIGELVNVRYDHVENVGQGGDGGVEVPIDYTGILQGISGILQSILSFLQNIFQNIVNLLQTIVNTMTQTIPNLVQSIMEGVESIANLLTEGLIGDIGSITIPEIDVSLDSKFPFSLPWDVARLVGIMNAEPKPPIFEAVLGGPFRNASLRIDVSEIFEEGFMQKVRYLELIAFCIGLAIITPRLIGGAK